MKKAPKLPPPPPTSEIVTFRDPRGYWLENLAKTEPSCFNGIVSIKKWKVAVTAVEEPVEVLIARLRKLWRECDNHYHWQPLKSVAAKLSIELDPDECGKDRK